MSATPNLDLLRVEIGRLLASGVEPHRVEDVFIGSSPQNSWLYDRALQEFSHVPRLVDEGKRHAEVDIKKSEGLKMESMVEKIERTTRAAAILKGAIDAYQREHGCSQSAAADAVLLSPSVSEYHRLDKALAAEQRDAIMDREVRKAARIPASRRFSTP
jgi:hypothetical protein